MSLNFRSPAIHVGGSLPEIAAALRAVKATLDVREGRIPGRPEERFVEKGEVAEILAEKARLTISDVIGNSVGDGPAAPSSFAVTEGSGGFKSTLSWTNPADSDLWAIEIIVNTTNNRPTGQSILVTIPSGGAGENFTYEHIHGEPTQNHYYWVRALDYALNPSEWVPNATTSTYLTQGQSSIDQAVYELIDVLKGGSPPAYDNGTEYTAGQIVTNGGTQYQCYVGPVTGVEPGVTANWEDNWRVTGILVQGNIDGVSTVGVNGDLIVDGTILARAIAAGEITANEINVTSVSGAINFDQVPNGTTYGKVALTNITSGNIVLQTNQNLGSQGIKIMTASSGARVELLPDANTGIHAIDNASNTVFKVLVGGTDVGDVQIGDYSGGQGILYDKSAGVIYYKNVKLTELSQNWETKTSDFTAAPGGQYLVDTSGGAVAMTLPASPAANDWVQWVDLYEYFGTNNFTINPGANNFHGSTEDVVCQNPNENALIEWTGATRGWVIN